MSARDLVRRSVQFPWQRRSDPAIGFDEWASMLNSFSYNGLFYSLPSQQQEEFSGASFLGGVRGAFKSDSVVFACINVRMSLFSEARFQFRQRVKGRPGNLFGNTDLAPLEHPWPGATTGDLLSGALIDADLAGNWYGLRMPGGTGIKRLRPDWVTLIVGSNGSARGARLWDAEAEVVGYAYRPGGPGSGRPIETYLAEDVAHFAPIPDPEAQFRGMSWLTPLVNEVLADKAATAHKLRFFENGATPNMTVKFDTDDLAKWTGFIEAFREEHEGAANAYRTLFLSSGMDANVVGVDLQQLEFKVTQGAGETRIAAAANVPPVIVGLSEGLAAATYSNYSQARRRFADLTMRPLWRNMAGSLERIINVPVQNGARAELWYDDRDIPFLAEDVKDAATVTGLKMVAIKTSVESGFTPESSVEAIDSGDLSRLVPSGLTSVQLQPPGVAPPPGQNGSAPMMPPAEMAAARTRALEEVLALARGTGN